MSGDSAANVHTEPAKRALVVCYTAVARDARVSKQIRWLEGAGYQVDVLSRGPEHPDATGRRFLIGYPGLVRRLLTYLLPSYPARFRLLVEKYLPLDVLDGAPYDLVVVNDHQLLPWIVEVAPDLTDGPVVLDLHELYWDRGTSVPYKVAIAPYEKWLMKFVPSSVFTRRLTVAEGIADIYRSRCGIPRPTVIRNVAAYQDLEPSPVDPEHIVLVHHGYAAVQRGIDVILDAALELEDRFTLVLMVLGDDRAIAPLRRHPAVAAGRVVFRKAVPVAEVSRALNEYDLEVAFFPPRYPNNVHALPNKFFEAVQGRLGIVTGESPEIVPFVRRYGFGLVVEGWSASELAAAINRLTPEDIRQMKRAASDAAAELSTRGEGPRLLEAIGA